MPRNQLAIVLAAIIVVIAIIGWTLARRGHDGGTSQPQAPSQTQQQTPPQPQ